MCPKFKTRKNKPMISMNNKVGYASFFSFSFCCLQNIHIHHFTKKGQYTKEINDFKMKNQKLEHENIVIKQDVSVVVISFLKES